MLEFVLYPGAGFAFGRDVDEEESALMARTFWVVSAALLDGPRVDRWHRRCGVGGHSSPPRARRPPGATIAFGRAVTVEESALMSRTLTGGVG